MAFDVSKLTATARGINSMLPVSLTYDGNTYNGTRVVLNRERQAELYGYENTISHSIWLIVDDLQTALSTGKTVVVDSETLRLTGWEYDSGRVMVRMDLAQQYG